ncbi:MAG: hypothetical protein HC915_08970 [Anaerolineae bacterium]|nr:hypothetical protein [Anaerolineae bacterium]
MLQPKLQGQALREDIAKAKPNPGQLVVWWLGQSGYIFKTASALWVVDPYLSEHLTHKYAETENPTFG